jgi:hypothetical protein
VALGINRQKNSSLFAVSAIENCSQSGDVPVRKLAKEHCRQATAPLP